MVSLAQPPSSSWWTTDLIETDWASTGRSTLFGVIAADDRSLAIDGRHACPGPIWYPLAYSDVLGLEQEYVWAR
ncbi:hypothetical protein N7468_002767 [Penicillium chermesinum]|uniref:Uncharacterized protein n=1 Tax=Penicillium chermesinum TaxID=63820 RepID=A0A9W9PJB8_9EURO|nr:uncharacterized protein N7468_002767 [Penicillium chermesinum]KAJ5247784.1 hypothetical protein N7468_002767 [Penicillium chermesinum]KAJ6151546.1 hypothetical protein N7470_007143 [Penicillium chermesinum]